MSDVSEPYSENDVYGEQNLDVVGEEDDEEQDRDDDVKSNDTVGEQEAGGRDSLANASEPLPTEQRKDEVPMRVRATICSVSPLVARPDSDLWNMDSVRFHMMVDVVPGADAASSTKKFYKLATPASGIVPRGSACDDGTCYVIARRAIDLLGQLNFTGYAEHPAPDVIKEAFERAIAIREWNGFEISVHVPLFTLQDETDDRGVGSEVGGSVRRCFVVNENMQLVCGRDRWAPTPTRKCQLNTEMKITYNGVALTFKYVKCVPTIETGDGTALSIDINKQGRRVIQAFTDLLHFSQYCERELKCARPPKYFPAYSELLLAACHPKSRDELRTSALLMYIGHLIRFEPTKTRDGYWWTYGTVDGSQQWVSSISDNCARALLKAAASDVRGDLWQMARRKDINVRYLWSCYKFEAIRESETDEDEGADEGGNPATEVRSGSSKLYNHRTSLMNLQFWVTEPGIRATFEKSRDIGYNNGIQQMREPFAFLARSPDHRVTTYMKCDLPPSPTTEAEKLELKEFALQHYLNIFRKEPVALREADKTSCFLTGSCQYMPEANIRPQIGPYDEGTGTFVGGVGKDIHTDHISTVLGGRDNFSTSLPAAIMSYSLPAGENNPMFEGIECFLGHSISDKDQKKKDGSGKLEPWGSLPKGIWTGGAPKDFPLMLKHQALDNVLPRSNAVCIASQRFGAVENEQGNQRRIEVSPFPRVPNTEKYQSLIDRGVETFEPDANLASVSQNMSPEDQGRHLRYMTDRAIEIIKDPKAAHPPTPEHIEATKKWWEVVGVTNAVPEQANEEDAMEDLADATDSLLEPCKERA